MRETRAFFVCSGGDRAICWWTICGVSASSSTCASTLLHLCCHSWHSLCAAWWGLCCAKSVSRPPWRASSPPACRDRLSTTPSLFVRRLSPFSWSTAPRRADSGREGSRRSRDLRAPCSGSLPPPDWTWRRTGGWTGRLCRRSRHDWHQLSLSPLFASVCLKYHQQQKEPIRNGE